MADRICGYPTNFTTVSAGTGGNVRVTYAPWELDWEFFDAIAIGHWLANTTTATSDDIVAKGGSEHLGYWFEISTAFPDANWNTGDRIAPQRQAAINQHATFALAVAAMAVNDVFLIWYRNLRNARTWAAVITFSNIAGSAWGMPSRQQLHLLGANVAGEVSFAGNLLAQNVQAIVANLTFQASAGSNHAWVAYSPAAAQEGQGVWVRRCVGIGSGSAGFYILRALAGTIKITNCVGYGAFGNSFSVNIAAVGLEIYDSISIYGGINMLFGANVAGRNLVAEEGTGVDFSGGALCQNCASTDGTLVVHATNLRNQDARTQLRFFHDMASPGQNKFPTPDGRIFFDSVLKGSGVALALVPRDADGRLRPDPPSIGAYEPYAVAYAPAAELIRGASKRGVQT